MNLRWGKAYTVFQNRSYVFPKFTLQGQTTEDQYHGIMVLSATRVRSETKIDASSTVVSVITLSPQLIHTCMSPFAFTEMSSRINLRN